MVHAEGADVAEGVGNVDCNVAILAQQRHQIGNRILPPVDLATLQRRAGGRGVGHDYPLDPLDQHPLAAGQPRSRFLARHITGESFESRLGARHPLVLHETHGAAADIFGDLLERVGLGDALGHDEGDRRTDLAEREQHFREWLLEHPLHRAVVDRHELLLDAPDQESHLVARRPTLEARGDVLGQHRFAVVEFESRAQTEGPGQAIGGNLLGLHHLPLWLQLFVHTIERVPHHAGGVAHDVLRAPDWVEIGEIGLRHEAKRARGSTLRNCRGRQSSRCCQSTCSCDGLQERPAIHNLISYLRRPTASICATLPILFDVFAKVEW